MGKNIKNSIFLSSSKLGYSIEFEIEFLEL